MPGEKRGNRRKNKAKEQSHIRVDGKYSERDQGLKYRKMPNIEAVRNITIPLRIAPIRAKSHGVDKNAKTRRLEDGKTWGALLRI